MVFNRKWLAFFVLLPVACFANPMVNIQHWKTKNNVPVYFVATHELPMLDAEIIFDAGSSRDGNAFGLASLTANMLDKGAGKENVEQLATDFDNVGAQFDVGTVFDKTELHLRSLTNPKMLNPALKTFNLVLSSPTFPQKSLRLIKNQTLTMIQAQQQDPSAVAIKSFMRGIYGDAPYGHWVTGSATTVEAIQQPQLKNFYLQYYVANNAVLVLVGNLNHQQAVAAADQITSGLQAGEQAKAIKESSAVKQSAVKHLSLAVPQTVIFIGNVAIARNNPDYFPLMVGNYILGGGMDSRLFNIVREQHGLSYNVNSQFTPFLAPGPFFISLQTKNQTRDQAVMLTKQVLTNFLQKGVTKDELVAAKQNLLNGLPGKIDSNAKLVNLLGNVAFYHLPLDYLDQYVKNVNGVTATQIRRVFNQYVHVDQLLTVTVGGDASGE